MSQVGGENESEVAPEAGGCAANHRADTAEQPASGPLVPHWRRIEALRERRALKSALADIWSDDPEFDDGIFFPGSSGPEGFYRHNDGSADFDSGLEPESDDI